MKKYLPIGASLLFLSGFLSGCTSSYGQWDKDFSLTYSKDGIQNIPSALEATAEQFFAAPPSDGSRSARGISGQDGGFVVDIGRDTLSSGGGTPYTEQASSKLQLRAGLERRLGDNAALVGGVSVSRGNSRYLLPQGAGVLVDPITIRFATRGVEVDAGIALFSGNRLESRVEFGAGGTLTETRTRINSALLDVANSSSDASGFVYTGIQLSLSAPRPGLPDLRLKARVKYYPDTGVSIRSGLALAF